MWLRDADSIAPSRWLMLKYVYTGYSTIRLDVYFSTQPKANHRWLSQDGPSNT